MQKCWNGYNLGWIDFRGPKNGFFSENLAIFPKNDFKITHFCYFYCFLNKNVPKNVICNARYFLTMRNLHFSTICFMTKKTYSHFHNLLRNFNVSPNFPFTSSVTWKVKVNMVHCTENYIFFFQTSWSFLYYRKRSCFFFPKI